MINATILMCLLVKHLWLFTISFFVGSMIIAICLIDPARWMPSFTSYFVISLNHHIQHVVRNVWILIIACLSGGNYDGAWCRGNDTIWRWGNDNRFLLYYVTWESISCIGWLSNILSHPIRGKDIGGYRHVGDIWWIIVCMNLNPSAYLE